MNRIASPGRRGAAAALLLAAWALALALVYLWPAGGLSRCTADSARATA